MAASGIRSGSRRAPIVAYGCVGAAVAFIFALTLGVFDAAEQPRHFASNTAIAVGASTP